MKEDYETEAELKRLVVSYLKIRQMQGALLFMQLNAGKIMRGSRRIQLVQPGTSDFYVLQDGKSIFLELKSRTGVLSEDQLAFAERVRECGGDYWCVRTMDEVSKLC